MAVTKIWDVKGWLGKVVIYIENPAKTENPAFYEKEGMTETQAQGLIDVIEYAVNAEKTEKQYYVSAVNCSTLTARSEMMAVKKRFGKEDGIVAFHGYQSFAEGGGHAGHGARDRRQAGGGTLGRTVPGAGCHPFR